MWTALLSAIPAVTGLLKGGAQAASSAASALCQQQLTDADAFGRRMVAQRNAALVAIPFAAVVGFMVGRRFK